LKSVTKAAASGGSNFEDVSKFTFKIPHMLYYYPVCAEKGT